MSEKPRFNSKMSSDVFISFYWYKEELQKICREYQLPSYGTKAELTNYIVKFLDGVPVSSIKPVRKIRRSTSGNLKAEDINLNTKLLNSGFSLNNEARKFFEQYYKVPSFSFRKSMGIKMREVERNADTNATVRDLIWALENSQVDLKHNKEEQTYQWNNFVRDFRLDISSKNYRTPMKVASILWKKVRDSNQEKKYSHKLMVNNSKLIEKYLK
ncbi:SAP domain-containing protein [Companilactobacillus alimentarius]|uniref:SAP domain-containing protein n=1 Tax=Companilactobacillus alimentarius DSM 20249 TaxID=1423720 RepID=A0A2K9HKA8_9LACO|nr:SAP domain-containing protein [Companilactobacillus alimentarius]AUI71245.1 hypothetical protein LA20249_03110 [Companilactobacillus alimentarius DSM 20249]KRK75383.1 hypothetical protein FC67_GL001899 [Companilactobacillus alimentarius DSM 20249]GEO43834.1 hypothetical protein LAL01_00660 [Companilactobacillus alimentarius]